MRTLIKSKAGVRLERIEELARGQKARTLFKLSTYRMAQPRTFSDETEAENAFDLEVIASLMDPVVSRMVDLGKLDA